MKFNCANLQICSNILYHLLLYFFQVKYLRPDQLKVNELVDVLQQKQIGVVAHFYMDPEVQGVLAAAKDSWPHIHISDSLVMADRAVKMADAGCKHIAVLGVDFMSENVRAILDRAGHEKVRAIKSISYIHGYYLLLYRW